jgi:molybdopterin molybdotransferase
MAPVYPLANARLGNVSLTGIDDAFSWIAALAGPVQGEESLVPAAAVGRVTVRDIVTAAALPRFDHAAMDGFGLCAADLARPVPFDLVVSERIFAGGMPASNVSEGNAVRLLTGAPIPDGVDALIPEEACTVSGDRVRIRRSVQPGTNIRRRGEDAPRGSVIVESGTRLDARHLAILAASGVSVIQARRPVRVGLLSIGDELRAAGEVLAPGQIHDSNGPMLKALLAAPSIDIVDLGLRRDDRAGLAALLAEAAERVDVLVSSAGVSGSDADHVATAMIDAGGTARTLKLALKPGKPLLAGRVRSTPMVGLPGNPVAALVNFMLFVRPLVKRRAGMKVQRPRGYPVVAAEPIAHKAGRAEFVPALILDRANDGRMQVAALRPAGAARLRPLVLADGLIEIVAGRDNVAAGEFVGFHPFRVDFSA